MGRGTLKPHEERLRQLISSNIKTLLNENGLKAIDLKRGTGIPQSSISEYINGKATPNLGKVQQIADFFGVEKSDIDPSLLPNWNELTTSMISPIIEEALETMKKLAEPRQEKVLLYSKEQLTEQQQENIIDIREFTYNYYDNAVSAGTGQYLTDGIQETITLPVNYDADFVVPVCGDSMEPIYHDWDYVFVETTYDLYDGDIGVFILDGDAYIKELRIDDEGAFLHSLNPKYRDKPILPESDFRIVGKVIGRYNEKDGKGD
jgi:Predicted transcriptional regulator